MAMESLLIIIVVLAVLLIVGVPISYSIGISALIAILHRAFGSIGGNRRSAYLCGHEQIQPDGHSFILAGNLMNQGGIAKRLVDFVMAILGKLPGAL